MADELAAVEDGAEAETIETPEAEADDVSEPETPDELEAEAQEDDPQEEDAEADPEEEEEIELIEFDFGGNKMELPKGSVPDELADKIDQFTKGTWSDYTKNKQELVEKGKALEAREGAVQKLESFQGEALEIYSIGLRLRQEIEQLESMNLNEMWQSDPDQARRVSDMLSAKQRDFQASVDAVSEAEAKLETALTEETERRVSEGKALIERQVPGFEAAHLPDVINYAVETLGIEPEAAKGDWALDPAITLAVHKAMLFDRMQAKAKEAKPKPAPAKPVKAKAKSGNTRGPSLDLNTDADKMSAAEWARRRNQQLAKRAQ